MIFSKALGQTLDGILNDYPESLLIGEDIVDPYGGAFKVTKGLSSKYPSRVRQTPISEAAIVGIGVGLAMEGFRPIVEIMFGDFASLTLDQILNHATKYPAMYNGKVTCPVVVRTPSGGGRAYGPTHSQSLEKFFIGVPYLNVVAPCLYDDLKAFWASVISSNKTTFCFEHKLLYTNEMRDENMLSDMGFQYQQYRDDEGFPIHNLRLAPFEECSATLVCYGFMAHLAEKVVLKLAIEEELFVDLLVVTKLSGKNLDKIKRSLEQTGRLLTVEEGTEGSSWGDSIISKLAQQGSLSACKVRLLSSPAGIIPSAKHLEQDFLVNEQKIEAAVRSLLK
jgi:pyruvate/2-oxoglutarate/acetoin dehydrogenase E1 component